MSRFLNTLRRASNGGGRGNAGAQAGVGISAILMGAGIMTYGVAKTLYTVEAGQHAVIFNKFTGVSQDVIREGTHIRIPFIEEPYIFDIRTKPETIRSPTGTRDLQTVDITLRVLYKPDPSKLPTILQKIGLDYNARVLPSIVNETLKAVVAQFTASELITQREQVSRLIAQNLAARAHDFHILLEDVSITHLIFGQEYRHAVEAKQVAQQDAERAKFIVKQAIQDKKSTIIKAEGEAKSAELIGMALAKNPGYIELRRLDAAVQIADVVANGKNGLYLDSNALMQSSLGREVDSNKR